jgi:FtsH-binding integral membrane protein
MIRRDWLAVGALALVAYLSVFPIRYVHIISPDPIAPKPLIWIIVAVFVVASATTAASVYLIILSARHVKAVGEDRATIAAYMFSVVPAVYGISASIFAAQALLALPFGVVAAVCVGMTWWILRRRSDSSGAIPPDAP